MDMRHQAFADLAPPLHRPRLLDEARIVPLCNRLTALFFDRPAETGRRARLTALLDGRPAPAPCIGTALALQSGGLRHLMLLMLPVAEVVGARIDLVLDGRPEAAAEPDWLQPPLRPLPVLLAGLGPAGRTQILKLMLTTGASLFAGAGGPDLAALGRQLLDLCQVPQVPAQGWTTFGDGAAIVSHRWEGAAPPQGAAMAVLPDRIVRQETETLAEPEAGRLHLHLNGRPPESGEVVIFAPGPVRLMPPPAGDLPQPLALWLQGRSDAARGWALGHVRTAAARSPAAAALLRELRTPDLPIRLDMLSLSAAPGGLLYAFRLEDAERLVRTIRFQAGSRFVEIAPSVGPDGIALDAGFAPLAEATEGEPCQIHLTLGSGRQRHLPEMRPQPYRGGIPDGFAEAWAVARSDGPAAALARARAVLPRQPAAVRIERFGPAGQARLALIAAVGANPDLIPARAALIGAEPAAHRAEVILTVPEGPRAEQARNLAAVAAEVHGTGHHILSHAADATPAEVLRAALALCPGAALLLGPDVLPAMPGWLGSWLDHLLRAEVPVTAGVLLDHDGAVAEAMTTIETGAIRRPFDGLPPDRLPSTGGTAIVSGSCAGLTPAAIARILAMPDGPADLPLVLAALTAGAPVTVRAAAPFIRFGCAPPPDPFTESVLIHGLGLLAPTGTIPETA